MTRRVVLADDQQLVRMGLRMILEEEGVEVIGEASNGAEAVKVARAVRPDVVLMDVRMPVMDGIEATRQLAQPQPGAGEPVTVLVLTTFDLDDYVYAALGAGASGFLLKDARKEQLLDAIEVVAAGDALLAPSVTRRLISHFATRRGVVTSRDRLGVLTAREREVLALVGRGMSNAEIADELVVSVSTVKTHVGSLLMKLGLRDRVQAVVLAYETGLVAPGEG
ncbi:MAG: response regulator [Egibacteraceae bacterium]